MTRSFRQRQPEPWVQDVARLVSESVLERILFCVQPPPLATRDQEWECPAPMEPAPSTPLLAEGQAAGPLRFFLDTLFLEDSFQHLATSMLPRPGQAPRLHFQESFHYATGPYVPAERLGLVSHLIAVEFARQSAGGVTVADDSNISALDYLDKRGLPLLLHVHSHPGEGVAATTPSKTDLAFQDRLERGRHVCIGGIFDRCGEFIRFFATPERDFSVVVQGRGVREVQPHVYRISLGNGYIYGTRSQVKIEQ